MVVSRFSLPYLPSRLLSLSGGSSVDVYEEGEGLPLIVLPGLAGGTALIRPLIKELAKRHRVIAVELRGEREGFLDRSYGFQQYVDDVQTLIDDMGLERPALFGFSFGAAIALNYAAQNPHRLAWLGVQGAGPVFHPNVFAQVVRRLLQRLRLPTDSFFINQFLNVLLGEKPQDQAAFDRMVQQIWRTEQSTMAFRMEQLDEYDVSDRLWRLETPTLVLSGERDVVTPASEAKLLADQLPHADYHPIVGAGHLASVTHSDHVLGQVMSFQREMQLA